VATSVSELLYTLLYLYADGAVQSDASRAVVYGQLTSVVPVHLADQVPVNRVASQLLLTHVIQFHACQPSPPSVVQNLTYVQPNSFT